MTGVRLTLSAVFGVLATFLAVTCLPAAANAVTAITIISAGPTGATSSQVQLSVEFNDDAGLASSVTMHITDSSNPTAVDVADPAMTTTSTTNDQTWTASVPSSDFSSTTSPYTMTVDVTDSGGTTSGIAAGTFNFPYNTTLSVSPSQNFVSIGSESVTFSGSVTGTLPGGSGSVGLAGVPVEFQVNSADSSQSPLTTGANGNFSVTVTGVTATNDYKFIVAATPAYTAPAAQDISIPVEALNSSVTMNPPAPASVTLGAQSVVFSGIAQGTPSGLSNPVGIPGGTVTVTGPGVPANTTVTTNNTTGAFSYTDASAEPGAYTFALAASPNQWTAASGSSTEGSTAATTTMTVSPTAPTVTEGSPNVTFSGSVTVNGGATPVPTGTSVLLSIGGGTPTPVTTTTSSGTYSYTPPTNITASNSYAFSVAADTNGLYTAASATSNVQVNQAASSINVTATPNQVGVGSQDVTFNGTVTAKTTTSTVPVAGAPIFLTIGSSTTATQVATTDGTGAFSYQLMGAAPDDYNFSVGSTVLHSAAMESVAVGLNQATTKLAVTASPSTVTEGSNTVTFSGTVTGAVAGGPSAPIANVPIDFALGTAKATQVAMTDTNGKFSYTVSNIGKAGDYNFTIASTGGYTKASAQVPVNAKATRTRIVGVTVTPAHLKYGQKGTIGGTVQYLSGSTWVGLGGTTIRLKVGTSPAGSIKTKAGGAFTATVSTKNGAGWTATLAKGPLARGTVATGALTVQVPIKVRSFNAGLSVFGALDAAGCVQVTVPYYRGPATTIELQYATKARGPWHDLGPVMLHNVRHTPPSCHDSGESYFSGAIKAKSDNAYYRVAFKSTANFDSVVSKTVHAWKYPTRITGYDITPRTVTAKGHVTITGRLWRKVGKSWRPYAHRRIQYSYRDKGTKYGGGLGSSETNAQGYFTQEFGGYGGQNFVATIYATYEGSGTDLAIRSDGIDVTNKGRHGDVSQLSAAVEMPHLIGPPVLSVADLGQEAERLTSSLISKL